MRNLNLSVASIHSYWRWWAVRPLQDKNKTKMQTPEPDHLEKLMKRIKAISGSLWILESQPLSSHRRDGASPRSTWCSAFGWESCTLSHTALQQDLFLLSTPASHMSCHMSYPSQEVGCESIFILARTLILFVINLPPLSHPSSPAKWLFKYSLNLF